MADHDPDRQAVINWLRARDFDAEAIVEADERTPDLKAVADLVYIIEVKRKVDGDLEIATREAQLAATGTAHLTESMKDSRRHHHAIYEIASQLKRRHEPKGLHLGWIICSGSDKDSQAHFIEAAAYGIGCVIDREAGYDDAEDDSVFASLGQTFDGHQCVYLYESCFHGRREWLDGLVLQYDVNGPIYILVNDRSERVDRLRNSQLMKLADGAYDPKFDTDRIVADCDNDRRHISQTLAYLGKRYGLAKPEEVANMTLHRLFYRAPTKPPSDTR